jgi:very-short-patch-repair endonuclease
LGASRGPLEVRVTVPTWRRSRTGFWLHCSSLQSNEITEVDGIPVTTVARTLLDLAAILPRDGAVRAVEAAERHELFDLRAVEALLGRAGRRAGTRLLRSVLADYREPVDLRSELERDFLALVRRSGLPIPQANVLVIGYLVDFHWPRSKLVVELDGRSYHSSPRAFELDRLRDAKLLRAGYRVLRVTYRRLRDDPAGVLGDLGALAA